MTTVPLTLLGLGRMGVPMAHRLAAEGWSVTAWNRTPRDLPDAEGRITVETDLAAALQDAEIVLLALFDAAACEEVLALARPHLRPGALVVNTATVGPQEAAALAAAGGADYVHAPVVGSVPQVEAGSLVVLAAGPRVEEARVPLAALGEVRVQPDATTAAGLKLVANASIGTALLALRDTLAQARALDLPDAEVLDVLSVGLLGTLVTRKRPFLEGADLPAQFTLGALAKDLRLLDDATPVAFTAAARIAAHLTDPAVGPDADIAAAVTAPDPTGS